MTQTPLPGVLPSLRRIFAGRESSNVPDSELLRRFVQQRDEAAFELLVWRHGRMVLHACRRILTDMHHAEDAFQATFLTLARRASSIRGRSSVSGWLHKVAFRIALASRARIARRQELEQPLTEPTPGKGLDPSAIAAWRDVRQILDREVNGLGERYRLPFILCYLEGKTNSEAAKELGCPVGTIESRLMRARQRLRARLTRQGLALSVGLRGLALARPASGAELPAALVSSTARMAAFFAGGVAAEAIPSEVFSMAEGVLRTMWLLKIKTTAILAVAILVSVTACVFGRPGLEPRLQAEKQPVAKGQAQHNRAGKTASTGEHVESGTIVKIDLAQGALVTKSIVFDASVFDASWNGTIGNSSNFILQPYLATPMTSTLNGNPSIWTSYQHMNVNPSPTFTFLNSIGHTVPISNLPASSFNCFPYPLSVKGTITAYGNEVSHKLAPMVSVRIDGEDAKLSDLVPNIPVQLRINKNGQVIRIEADGSTMNDCLIDSLDPVKNSLAVAHAGSQAQWEIGQKVKVLINNKKSRLADLKPEMTVSLRLSAIKPKILGITATGPMVECVLKSIDAERGRLTVGLKKEHITVSNLVVDAEAPITIDGRNVRLVDLQSRVGRQIHIQMDADAEQNRVVAVQYESSKAGK